MQKEKMNALRVDVSFIKRLTIDPVVLRSLCLLSLFTFDQLHP